MPVPTINPLRRTWHKRTVGRALALTVAGWTIAAGIGVALAPDASADPVRDAVSNYGLIVCEVLDTYPTVDGVVGVLTALVEDGYAPGQAGNIVFKSVVAFCDYHLPVVQAFVDEYTKPAVAASRIA